MLSDSAATLALKGGTVPGAQQILYMWLSSNEPASKAAFDCSKLKSLNLHNREKVCYFTVIV